MTSYARITDLPLWVGSLPPDTLIEVVQPGNASLGQSYQATIAQVVVDITAAPYLMAVADPAIPTSRNVVGESSVVTTTDGGVGSTFTIGVATAGITNTKLATMATHTIKANLAVGSASPTDATPTAVLDLIGSTQGNILYRNATQWVPLSPGAAGQALLTGGAAANPAWGSAPSASITVNLTDVIGGTAGQILYTDGTLLQAGGNVKTNSLALGGATIGGNSLAVTGTVNISGNTTLGANVYSNNLILNDSGPYIILGTVGFGIQAVNRGNSTHSAFVVQGASGQSQNLQEWNVNAGAKQAWIDTGGSFSSLGAANIFTGTAIPAGGTANFGFTFSSTSNFGAFFGSGAPTLSAAQGSIYLRSDGLPYYNTNGTTGWAQLASTGGAAIPSIAQGDTLYGSATNVLSALAKDTNATRYLSNTGTSNNPAWAQVALTTGVSGILPLASGGTNANLTASTGGIVYSGASALAILAGTATASLPLLSGSTAAPTWATISYPTSATSGGVPYFSSATAISSSALLAANQLVIGGGAGTAPATLGSLGTTTTVLHGNAAGAPSFGAVSLTADVSGTLPVANGGTGIATTTAYSVICAGTTATGPFQSLAALGASGTVLTSNGAGALPSFQAVAGTGTVTSITPGNGLTSILTATAPGSAITTSGTLSTAQLVNAQTGTSYAIVDGDRGKLITASNAAAQAYTIAQAGATSAFQAGWYADVRNISTNPLGVVTITPSTSTINGLSSLIILPGGNVRIVSDGANYQVTSLNIQPPSLSAGGGINKFRNGTMDIWQRGTSALASAATTVNGYQVDGWITNNTFSAGAGPVMSQVANNRTGAMTLWALKILGATNCTDVIFQQRIESYIAAQFGTQTVTVQAQVFNNTGGSITPTLTVKYPTATDNYASTTTDSNISGTNLQACANGAWTQVSYTFTPTGTVGLGMQVMFDFGNNFSANTKYVYVTELDIRATPGVVIGLNGAPPVPELRPIPGELLFCQRYFFQWNSDGAAGDPIIFGQAISTTVMFGSFQYATTMRASPTFTPSVVASFSANQANNSRTALSGFVISNATVFNAALVATVGSGVLVAGNSSAVFPNVNTATAAFSSEI